MMLYQPHSQNSSLKGLLGKNLVPWEGKRKQFFMFPMNKVEVIATVKENIFTGVREEWSLAVEYSYTLVMEAKILYATKIVWY